MRSFLPPLLALGCLAAPLNAAPTTVTLAGSILTSCVLAIGVDGVLVADSTGTQLRSTSGVGARAATLTIVATGLAPTLTFAAPNSTGPVGFTPDSVQFSYSLAVSGASRGMAATGGTATAALIDTASIHGLITKSTGFPGGNYTETVDVTCG